MYARRVLDSRLLKTRLEKWDSGLQHSPEYEFSNGLSLNTSMDIIRYHFLKSEVIHFSSAAKYPNSLGQIINLCK